MREREQQGSLLLRFDGGLMEGWNIWFGAGAHRYDSFRDSVL